MINESGITPLGHRIVVLPEEVESKTESGIILHAKSTEREEMAQTKGVVIAIGEDAYNDTPSKWCREGDAVIFAKYSGLLWDGHDGKKYRVLNDLDIVAIID
jgi:co-chaperonin GroES (HSP10)